MLDIATIALAVMGTLAIGTSPVAAQQVNSNRAKTGYLIDVPVPLESGSAAALLEQLARLAERGPDNERVTVVLRYAKEIGSGDETAFEDALRVARAITSPALRRVRVVSWLEGEVNGHSILPILASDLLLVSPDGSLENASAGEAVAEKTIALTYGAIAELRGLFPPAVVAALVDPELELVRVNKVDGDQVFAVGSELDQLRRSGDVVSEDVWSAKGAPLRIDVPKLRSSRIAAGVVRSVDEAANLLDLAELNPVADELFEGQANGILLNITGSVVDNRARRWQSNLNATLQSGDVNTWVIALDSSGGSLGSSAELAFLFASPQPPLRTVAGWVRGEARGDAALIALACKPLMMKPESTLGGPGAEALTQEKLSDYLELIDQVATATRRPAALIRGLLDPSLEVYRYTNRKTGRVRYATETDLVAGAEDVDAERGRWDRGERIELANGLSPAEAIALGLADAQARSLDDASRRVGLSETPPAVADRGLVRFVEKVGRNNGLAFLLLFIGFAALSAEANAPGLSFPGFIALLCFGLYFWMKFLAGTAEWLELVAFSLGIICIAIEVFIVPGFGVFGIGGLALTVLGVVLMSQTFVIPRNVYQMQVLTRGVWMALGGVAGMIGGLVAVRMMLPHVPLLGTLVMEAANEDQISESEKLGDFSHLLGQTGAATTPLRPSGKARFGDQVIQVVSDGTAIAAGDPVRVSDVHGTKVVVESVENE